MTFKHLVGKSTLKEGITIHKNLESFSKALIQEKKNTLHFSTAIINQCKQYFGD